MDAGYQTPDHACTPGVVDPTIVADLSKKPHLIAGIEHNICAPDFRTGPFRHTSEAVKKKACAEYGAKGCPGSQWEVDHVISLELGGADQVGNLWPEAIHQARIKDHAVEDNMGGPRGLVCQGKMSLRDAQAGISADWVKYGKKIGTMR